MVGVADECWPDDLVDTGAKDGVQMRRIENGSDTIGALPMRENENTSIV